MTTESKSQLCRCEQRTKEIRVEIEPSRHHIVHYAKNEAQRIQWLEQWAKELREFFRDHRSMDVNDVVVVRETEDVCSECGYRWEAVKYAPGEGDDPFEPYMGCGYCTVPCAESA